MITCSVFLMAFLTLQFVQTHASADNVTRDALQSRCIRLQGTTTPGASREEEKVNFQEPEELASIVKKRHELLPAKLTNLLSLPLKIMVSGFRSEWKHDKFTRKLNGCWTRSETIEDLRAPRGSITVYHHDRLPSTITYRRETKKLYVTGTDWSSCILRGWTLWNRTPWKRTTTYLKGFSGKTGSRTERIGVTFRDITPIYELAMRKELTKNTSMTDKNMIKNVFSGWICDHAADECGNCQGKGTAGGCLACLVPCLKRKCTKCDGIGYPANDCSSKLRNQKLIEASTET